MKMELETLIQTIEIYSKERGMEFGIKRRAMRILKRAKRQIGRNRTGKSKKKNAWRIGKLQVLGNTGSSYHQTSGDKK